MENSNQTDGTSSSGKKRKGDGFDNNNIHHHGDGPNDGGMMEAGGSYNHPEDGNSNLNTTVTAERTARPRQMMPSDQGGLQQEILDAMNSTNQRAVADPWVNGATDIRNRREFLIHTIKQVLELINDDDF